MGDPPWAGDPLYDYVSVFDLPPDFKRVPLFPPKKAGRPKKKPGKQPRELVFRGRVKRPASAAQTKALWQDHEYRAKQAAARAAYHERLRGQPSTNTGVPWGMRKRDADVLNQQARESAAVTMAELEKAGVLEDADEQAKEALQTSIEIMRQPGDKKVRLQAARQVLEWTKAKPAAKQDITVNKAEEWLAAIAAENDEDKGDAPSDA